MCSNIINFDVGISRFGNFPNYVNCYHTQRHTHTIPTLPPPPPPHTIKKNETTLVLLSLSNFYRYLYIFLKPLSDSLLGCVYIIKIKDKYVINSGKTVYFKTVTGISIERTVSTRCCCEPVWPSGKVGKHLGSNPLQLSFLFISCGLWTVLWLSLTINKTLKCFSSPPILMQEPCWWWQCSDRYVIYLSPHFHTPPPSPHP